VFPTTTVVRRAITLHCIGATVVCSTISFVRRAITGVCSVPTVVRTVVTATGVQNSGHSFRRHVTRFREQRSIDAAKKAVGARDGAATRPNRSAALPSATAGAPNGDATLPKRDAVLPNGNAAV
jgi:hypothetical protein